MNQGSRTGAGFFRHFIFCICMLLTGTGSAYSQAELMPWGNLAGIRIKGQLFRFQSAIKVVAGNGVRYQQTAKEHQRPHFSRDGKKRTVNVSIDSLYFTETVTNAGTGRIRIEMACTAHSDTTLQGIYYLIDIPKKYDNVNLTRKENAPVQFASADANKTEQIFNNFKTLTFTAGNNEKITVTDKDDLPVIFPKTDDTSQMVRLYLPLHTGPVKKGDVFRRNFEIRLYGTIDNSPAVIKLDTTRQGRLFAGFGGNFRLQNPKADPQVIDYCVNNMRIAWGRVEMPWQLWQPELNSDPVADADNGKLHPHVRESMEMAQRLGQLHMPVIVTAWFPPAWAAEGPLHMRPVNGIWGNPLNKDRLAQIYKSIADYLIYLRDHYGVEAWCFSFNESDLGINVRQTAQEHDELIRNLGAYFISRGLKTKLLLGDNSDATTYHFIDVALNDPLAKPYIGAVSFHSWRGWDTPTLQKWADAATQLNLPLLVGEGSIDAAAYAYPQYFLEQSYALEEINLYTRLLSICQPVSILQWQLTSDYSPLKGGGIYGDDGPLEPTQRFFNLKQLASTPENVFAMPAGSDNAGITCAGLGNNSTHTYAIHLVNNGAKRKTTITGLPSAPKNWVVWITNQNKQMKQSKAKVTSHEMTIDLPEDSFVSIIGK